MEGLAIWDDFGLSMLAGTTDIDSNMQAFLAQFPMPMVYGPVYGPMQAASSSGSSTPSQPSPPHIPEESGEDSPNIDMNQHLQPESQMSYSHHVVNYAPLNALLIPHAPLLLSPEGDGLRPPPADSALQDRMPPLKIVAYKGERMKVKREIGGRCHAYRVDALVRDKNPRSRVKRDERGLLQGAYRDFGTNERVRSHSHTGSRSTTAVTRAVGACGRCRGQKLKCTVSMNMPRFMPCDRCSALPRQYLKAPCIRVSILDLNLHRRGSTLKDDLNKWALAQEESYRSHFTQTGRQGPEVLDVVITQDQGIQIPVKIRRFHPRSGDTTGWKWRDGTSREKVMEMPPFYICDYEGAARNMREAVASQKAEYIDYLLGAANPILKKTFEAAFGYLEVSASSLILNCLTFWVATRFIEKPWRICEGTLPGFESPYDPACPYSGITPVTPIMDTQIDDMAIRAILNPLEKKILKELNCKIHEKKRENWFDIYLATFILMNNFEFVFADVLDYTSRHGLQPSTTGASSLSKRHFYACKTILVYFRFACNGHAPFSLPQNRKSTGPINPTNGLTFDQQEYIRDIKQEVGRQRHALEGWQEGSVYRTPLYLCYQVLAEDWSADVPHSEPIDDFTEEDFLTS
ncbi:hypothetical protein F4821DRAFT_236104 [Hypoxylon rubiginosum]|uniref:Uncharacterized protein n=1 Tax=Hypoxylon rubiginosum TaxID=110542 RepID=A0ACC0D4C5_9PEZI|nr:hypothetical protein F4821DRAFT_236104 [Hypoxylon rubiginosum]